MSAFFDFTVQPLPEVLKLGVNDQPYYWSGFYGQTGRLQRIGLEFGGPRFLNSSEIAGFYLTRSCVLDGSLRWEFSNVKDEEPPSYFAYPREQVMQALQGHTDPILASALASDIEAWFLELWDSATILAQRRAPQQGEFTYWLRQHNGKVDLGQPQKRLTPLGVKIAVPEGKRYGGAPQ